MNVQHIKQPKTTLKNPIRIAAVATINKRNCSTQMHSWVITDIKKI